MTNFAGRPSWLAFPGRYSTIAMLILLLVGCGSGSDIQLPELGEVDGTVTMDGKPLAGASIMFVPATLTKDQKESVGITDDNGNYVLTYFKDIKGAAIGTHTVRISKLGENEQSVVPAKYSVDSKLTADVQPGKNTFKFDLTSP